MALSPGSRVGDYEIVALLGVGGMGEVYRARDARLRRHVAIKILPDVFTRDPQRVARFEREARTLASLNHPNIASIYGLAGDAGGASALVLELVEGETLADRLTRGPIPIRDALEIARQIADALEGAHRQNIVHRDLKPANVCVTPAGTVKVLDFGLAGAARSPTDPVDAAATETAISAPGLLVGTPAYMSPEQARGQSADERSDIWAFGCVLYEMLIGRRAFAGATSVDVLAAVIHQEPKWDALPPQTPPLVRRLLRRCLRAAAKDRFQHAGDLRLDLEEALAPESVPATERIRRPRSWGVIVAGIVLIAAAATAAFVYGRSSHPVDEIRFQMTGGVPITPLSSVAISPDGRHIVVAPLFESGDSASTLWLRPIDSIAGRSLPGTTGAFLPFWSPDGGSIGFFTRGKLMRVNLQTGMIDPIAAAPIGRGAAWTRDGRILFAPAVRGPLQQVAATGGAVTPLTALMDGQNDHRSPVLLPGDEHFLYYARGRADVRGVFVARKDGTMVRKLRDADAPAVYAPTGHLLFVQETTLFAQPFDARRLELTGPAAPIAESVTLNRGVSLTTLAASPAGTIAYGVSGEQRWQFWWLDRQGKRVAQVGESTYGGSPSLSPDRRTLAFNRVMAGTWDIWTVGLERGDVGRVTSDPQLDFGPVWLQDGRRIVFQSLRPNSQGSDLVVRSIDGAQSEQVVASTPFAKVPTDVSRDGRLLLFNSGSSTSSDVWVLSLEGERNPRPILQTPANEREGQFSPDGNWLAYSSDASGRSEVFVQPYPGPGSRVPVSTAGGNQLRWGSDGRELFYVDPEGWLNAVPVTIRSAAAIEIGKPAPLFETSFAFATTGPRAGYVVASDGQRFLMNMPPEGGAPPAIAVMLNWKGPR